MEDTARIHHELEIAYPDGFHLMSAEELQQAYKSDYPNMWGIRDEDRHIIIAIFWKESNELLTKLVNAKSQAKRVEKLMAKGLKGRKYHFCGNFATTVAGCEAHGFRYGYLGAGDVPQDAETILFTHGKTSYTLYYYTRPETAAANLAIRDAIVSSLRFV